MSLSQYIVHQKNQGNNKPEDKMPYRSYMGKSWRSEMQRAYRQKENEMNESRSCTSGRDDALSLKKTDETVTGSPKNPSARIYYILA